MKRAAAPFLLAILVAASGVGSRESCAQRGYSPRSIEWLTASSDVVVVASVVDLAYQDRASKAGEVRSQWQWVTVTLKVRATLKGNAPETIVFVVEQARGMNILPRWKESAQSVLWFLVDRGDTKEESPRDFPAARQGKLRLREHWFKFLHTSALELGSPKTGERVPDPVFSMDFRVLDEEDQILEAVKAEVSRSQKRTERSIRILMPPDVAARSGRFGAVNVLHVPVDDRLEQLARSWVQSKAEWRRHAGVQALGPFKSDANIAILKGMLDDQGSWVSGRVHYIREAAYETLQEWKVPVPKPELKEPLKKE